MFDGFWVITMQIIRYVENICSHVLFSFRRCPPVFVFFLIWLYSSTLILFCHSTTSRIFSKNRTCKNCLQVGSLAVSFAYVNVVDTLILFHRNCKHSEEQKNRAQNHIMCPAVFSSKKLWNSPSRNVKEKVIQFPLLFYIMLFTILCQYFYVNPA